MALSRQSPEQVPEIRRAVAKKVVKGRPNMNLQSFITLVNETLLNHGREPGFPGKVSSETARKWLYKLGFNVIDAKKMHGIYVDSHKRSDVVEYRQKFLRKRFPKQSWYCQRSSKHFQLLFLLRPSSCFMTKALSKLMIMRDLNGEPRTNICLFLRVEGQP